MMINKLNIKITLLFFFLIGAGLNYSSISAQSHISGTVTNNVLKTLPKSVQVKNLLKAASLSVPFFDDFSNAYNPGYYPLDTYWSDNKVFINYTFEYNPISSGVATFDGFDENGDLYTQDTLGTPFTADTLTSQPINLSGKTQAVLSYYYQPQGLGDEPEKYDSLIVQLFSPVDSTWTKIDKLSFPGSPLKEFTRAIYEITESKYLQNGFRFRFMNIVTYDTIMGNIKVGNCDNWNIDYVSLNTNQDTTDTIISDITYRTGIFPIYKDYVTVPWHHFQSSIVDLADTMKAYITNYNIGDTINLLLRYYYKDSIEENTSGNLDKYEFEIDIFPNVTISPIDLNNNSTANNILDVTYQSTMEDTTIFIISSEVIEVGNPNLDIPVNNRVTRIQEFRDYYAYDDGSAEKGWSFWPGKYEAWLATKFKSYDPDTLYSISVYLNSILPEDDQGRFFDIICYSVDPLTNLPDELLCQQQVEVPAGFYGYKKFWLDNPVFVENEIFVGIHQENPKSLNLGFDCNDTVHGKFYTMTTYPQWEEINDKGVVMIRAGFYPKGLLPTGIPDHFNNKQFALNVFPNPANNIIYLTSSLDKNLLDKSSVEIIDALGRTVFSQKYSGAGIQVSDLSTGLYLVKVSTPGFAQVIQKFIITR